MFLCIYLHERQKDGKGQNSRLPAHSPDAHGGLAEAGNQEVTPSVPAGWEELEPLLLLPGVHVSRKLESAARATAEAGHSDTERGHFH